MKNDFYFMLKGLLVLKSFKFLSWTFGYVGKQSDDKVISSQTGKETITIHILPNIARVIGNQTKKSGPLIEYNMKNIFFKNDAEKKEEQQVPVFFLFSQKGFYKVNVKGQHHSFNIFW